MLSELDKTPAIKHILIINVLVFLALNVFKDYQVIFYTFSRFYIDSPNFKIWQVFTSSFLHFDLMHLLGNMFIFVYFGMQFEKLWGTKKFLYFCAFSALGGSIFTFLYWAGIMNYIFDTFFPIHSGIPEAAKLSDLSSRGFSAISSAILAATAYIFPSRKLYLFFLPIGIPALFLVGFYMLEDLVLGIRNILSILGVVDYPLDRIGHFAHLGGAIFGILLLMFWQKNRNSFY